jgi:ankyrin repeat protein
MTLSMVAASGHLDVATFALDYGLVDIHAQNDYALRQAASNGYFDMVQLLVYRGANVHANNNFALQVGQIMPVSPCCS